MITVQFANGKQFQVNNIDEAIAQCLAGRDDPFNPVVIETVAVKAVPAPTPSA